MRAMNQIIEQAEQFIRERLGTDSSGHDWYHMDRVRRLSLEIARKEDGADLFIAELAALLHDIPDPKLDGGTGKGRRLLHNWLDGTGLSKEQIRRLEEIIYSISFSKGVRVLPSLEAKIVQDADRLDAIGAVGVARAFAYGGQSGQLLYNPEGGKSTIRHFYDKLLQLKDHLHTQTAKDIAEERHQYMAGFLQQFYKEWDV